MTNSEPLKISSLDNLRTEMRRVEQRIDKNEKELSIRWNRLPEEAIKATIIGLIPGFLANGLGSNIWNLIKGLLKWTKGKNSQDSDQENPANEPFGAVATIGLLALFKMIFNKWKRK